MKPKYKFCWRVECAKFPTVLVFGQRGAFSVFFQESGYRCIQSKAD